MTESTGNPLRDLEIEIEREGEEYKRRRLTEELQKLADRVPALSPPDGSAPAPGRAPRDDAADQGGQGER